MLVFPQRKFGSTEEKKVFMLHCTFHTEYNKAETFSWF